MTKTRSGREIIVPTSEDAAAITAAAISDPDVLAKVRYPRKGEQHPGLSASQAQLPRVQLKGHIAALCNLLQPMDVRRNAPSRSQRCVFQGLMTGRPAASKGPVSRVATVKPWTAAVAAM